MTTIVPLANKSYLVSSPRLHQHQPGEPHVLHSPGDTADIARMRGIHQHDTNIVEIHGPVMRTRAACKRAEV